MPPPRESLFLNLFKLKIIKKIIRVSKRNKILIIKIIKLDLISIIKVNSNLTTL